MYKSIRNQSDSNKVAAQECLIFRLPHKIRNKIYAYVVTYKDPISIQIHNASDVLFTGRHQSLVQSSWRFTPPLLLTCRKIQVEAAPTFYANNAFFVNIRDGDIGEIVAWLQQTPPACLGQVKLLVLDIQPASLADLVAMSSASVDEVVGRQALELVEETRQAGLKAECMQVYMPEMKFISKDALLMHFDVDDAENIRSKWLSALESEMEAIKEGGLVDEFEGLIMKDVTKI